MWPFDQVIDAVNYIPQFFMALLDLVMYGPVSFIEAAYNIGVYEINILIALVNSIIGLLSCFSQLLAIITNMFPDSICAWVLGACITVNVLYRVYHFVKDVSIAGCKI